MLTGNLIRLLLQKQSNLGLHCFSGPFRQAISVRNFRAFTIYEKMKPAYENLVLIA